MKNYFSRILAYSIIFRDYSEFNSKTDRFTVETFIYFLVFHQTNTGSRASGGSYEVRVPVSQEHVENSTK